MEWIRIRRALVALLILISFTSCASSSLFNQAINVETYVESITVNDIVISDVGDIKTPIEFKNKIARAVARYPQLKSDYVKHIFLKRRVETNDGTVVSGRIWFRKHTIELALYGYSDREIVNVLHHEIGHALNYWVMTKEQEDEWFELYQMRLARLGLKRGVAGEWKRAKWYIRVPGDLFPSRYCLFNVYEYIAEHLAENATSPYSHKVRYPYEHALIENHEVGPTKK